MTTYPRTSFAETVAQGNLFAVSRPYRRKDRPNSPRPWLVEFRDPLTDKQGKRSFRTEREAHAFYQRVMDDREALRTGSLSRRQVAMGAKGMTPPADALAAYIAHMQARRLTAHHIHCVEMVIKRACEAGGWTAAKQIRGSVIESWLMQFKGSTARKYWRDLRAWVRWMLANEYLPEDPLIGCKPPAESEPMRKRAMSDAEFASLIGCEAIRPHRRLWYWLSGRLGLRHREIGRLTWGDIDFNDAMVRLPGARTKNRRDAVLPIPSSLMAVLREARQAPAMRVCRIMVKPCNDTWIRDLQHAGIERENEHGLLVQSSLRKTFVTHLARKGVDLRTAQRLARHSDINLTAKIYTEVLPSELRDAVEKLG